MRCPLAVHPVPKSCGFSRQAKSSRHHSQLLSPLGRTSPVTSALFTRSLFTARKPRPFRKALTWTLLAFGVTFGVAYHLDSRSAVHRWFAIPLLQAVTDPETAQKLAVKLLSLGVMPRDLVADDKVLATEVCSNS